MIHLEPDGLPDDRVTCAMCTAIGRNNICQIFRERTLVDLKRRCIRFVPNAKVEDRRTGKQRWPDIVAQVEEVRRMDQAHYAGKAKA